MVAKNDDWVMCLKGTTYARKSYISLLPLNFEHRDEMFAMLSILVSASLMLVASFYFIVLICNY